MTPASSANGTSTDTAAPSGSRASGGRASTIGRCSNARTATMFRPTTPTRRRSRCGRNMTPLRRRMTCATICARAKGGKPFLLLLAWGPPHNPYETAPAKYKAMYDPAKLELRRNVPGGNVKPRRARIWRDTMRIAARWTIAWARFWTLRRNRPGRGHHFGLHRGSRRHAGFARHAAKTKAL